MAGRQASGGGVRRSPPLQPQAPLTLGTLVQAAGIGVEAVRYCQRRGLSPQPVAAPAAHRRHPPAVAARLRFIRRAQQLGFRLDEIAGVLQPDDGTDRRSIRRVTAARLAQRRERRADTPRMVDALEHVLLESVQAERAPRRPLIEAIKALPVDHRPAPAAGR